MSATDFLTPDEYLAVVAPVLETCTALAAERGDPLLYNDLPSMLAVTLLIDGMGQLHRAASAPLGQVAEESVYRELPFAVAVMVLLEGGVESPRLEQMETALRAIHARVAAGPELEAPRLLVAPAWVAVLERRQVDAKAALRIAARRIIAVVEALDTAGADPGKPKGLH
jgi:hypothetical protein